MPFGHQKLDGVVVGRRRDDGGARREAGRRHVGARGLDSARPGRPRAVDGRGVLLDARAGAARWSRRRPARPSSAFWAEPTGADGRVNDNQAALLARLPGPAGGDLAALRRLEKRGLVTITERVAPPRAAHEPGAGHARRAQRRPGRRAGGDRGRTGRGAPAARRHRLGQDRGLPARGGGRARARRGRDRARAGDRADAADRGALLGALRRHRRAAALRAVARASATTSGGACAPGRRGSPSARARPSSRRSRGSV